VHYAQLVPTKFLVLRVIGCFALVSALLACTEQSDDGAPCNDDSACRSGEICVDGRCAPWTGERTDAGTTTPPRDAGANDAGASDAGASDAGASDAGASDAGASDAGASDAGVFDAGAVDAGAIDAGAIDAGAVDAGAIDAGAIDAGETVATGLRIIVTAGADTPAGYAIALAFDHEAFVTTFGADVRGAGLRLRELPSNTAVPLVLDDESTWNAAATNIWFRLANELPAGERVAYELSSLAATTIADWTYDDVFTAGDDFEDGVLGTSLTPSIHLGAQITETGGGLVVDMGDDQAEAAVLSATTPLPDDRRFAIAHRMRLDSIFGDDTSHNVKVLGIAQWPEQPGFAPNNVYGENRRQRIVINQGFSGKSWVYFEDANNDRWSWTDAGWQAGYASWGTLPFATDHIFAIESDGDDFVLSIRSSDGQDIVRTDPRPWSNVLELDAPEGQDVSTGPFWFYWGEPYVTGEALPDGGVTGGPYYTADLRSEWVRYRPYVSPEPVATVSLSLP